MKRMLYAFLATLVMSVTASAASLLSQVAQAPVAGMLPGLFGIGTFAYTLYMALIEKHPRFQEMMTGLRALVPIAVLTSFALIPAATLTLFGPMETLMTVILEISTVGLIGFALAVAVYQFTSRFAPEYVE